MLTFIRYIEKMILPLFPTHRQLKQQAADVDKLSLENRLLERENEYWEAENTHLFNRVVAMREWSIKRDKFLTDKIEDLHKVNRELVAKLDAIRLGIPELVAPLPDLSTDLWSNDIGRLADAFPESGDLLTE